MKSNIFFDFPKTSIEFDEKFSTEESCERYLFEKRWGTGFECKVCKHTTYWKGSRGHYICKKCEHHHSLKAGTIMQKSKKPLKFWFKAIWLFTMSKRGVNAKDLERQLGLSYPTAWLWLQKLKRSSLNSERSKLTGDVEVDEFYLGGKEKGGKQGRGSKKKHKVVIAIEKLKNEKTQKEYIGRLRLKVISSCSSENLVKFIKDNITTGSHINTDKWSGYNNVSEEGYNHIAEKILDYNVEFKGLHNTVSLIKRWILGTFQGRTSSRHIQWYLEEFIFRFNRRTFNIGLKFDRLLEFSISHKPMTYKQIIGDT